MAYVSSQPRLFIRATLAGFPGAISTFSTFEMVSTVVATVDKQMSYIYELLIYKYKLYTKVK